MILRIDDTDIERNTQASLDSIFDGLKWLDLGWDEQYRQSERLALHKEMAEAPMPFIIRCPHKCVEFTWPKTSTSKAVFMEMMPNCRTMAGLLEISCGRSTNRRAK